MDGNSIESDMSWEISCDQGHINFKMGLVILFNNLVGGLFLNMKYWFPYIFLNK